MGEYGQWIACRRPLTDEQVAQMQDVLGHLLRSALQRQDLEPLPWDVEVRYGRERLGLTDEQQAVGVHVVIDDG